MQEGQTECAGRSICAGIGIYRLNYWEFCQRNRTGTAIAIRATGSLRRLMVLSFWAIIRDAELVLRKRRAGDHLLPRREPHLSRPR